MTPLVRVFLVAGGIFCIAVGVMGIFLPLLPTTPFLLLAGLLLSRSSPRVYRWLQDNRLTGPFLEAYRNGGGIVRRRKVFTIVLLWTALTVSGMLTRDRWWIPAILAVIGIGVTVHLAKLPEKIGELRCLLQESTSFDRRHGYCMVVWQEEES